MGFKRDPVGELFDRGARQLLDRAYARPGQWVGTRITGPSPAQVAYFAAQGINVLGRDDFGRDRWAAGFIKAVYHQHKWYRTGRGWGPRRTVPNEGRAIRHELGRQMRALGVIPAGRAVRLMSKPGGPAAARAASRLPYERRIFAGDAQGPRAVDSTINRDWGLRWQCRAAPTPPGPRYIRRTVGQRPAGPGL